MSEYIEASRHLPLGDSLVRYIERGYPVGGFLTAVLTNNLVESYGRADSRNIEVLRAYVSFLYNNCPTGCWGSREKVDAWIAKGGLLGNQDNQKGE